MAAKNSERVKDIIRFVEQLIVPSGKGEGNHFRMRSFQRKFLQDVYGPLDKNDLRIVRRAILSMGRKNGKTMLTACLALVHLVGPEAINNGEIYSAANSREQASKVFKYAAQIVRSDPELGSYIKIVDSTKTMVCFGNGSIYRAVSAEAGTNYGENPSLVIYDELSQAKNSALYDAFDTSMGAREEPLMIIISTQSNDPTHILSELIDDAIGGHTKTIVCHLYAVPDDEKDVFDPKCWKQANPALRDFLSIKEMRDFALKAKRMPGRENTFRNLYLNQRVDAKSPLIPRAEWEACHGDVTIQPGDEIYLGLDLSGKTDLTALVATGNGDKDVIQAWFWKPEDSLSEHEKRDRVPYSVWKRQGIINTSPGRAIQYAFIAQELAKIHKKYKIVGMAFDRWRIDDLLNVMDEIGLESYVDEKDNPIAGAIRLVPWGQGYVSMAPALDALEESILDRRLMHDGNPCLTWNFSNAVVKDNEVSDRKFDKSKARFRIDGAVATAMAIGLKSRDRHEAPKPFVYVSGNIDALEVTDANTPTPPEPDKLPLISEEILCIRCEKETNGKIFCPNCGTRQVFKSKSSGGGIELEPI